VVATSGNPPPRPGELPGRRRVADRAYDSDDVRDRLLDRDIGPNIPSKANRLEPIEYDAEAYRERNKVERLVGRFKQFRGVATRYEKLGATFLAIDRDSSMQRLTPY
jgi:transposase